MDAQSIRDPLLATPRGYTLALLTALAVCNHLDRQLMSILLEPVRTEFGLSDLQLGLLSGLAFAALYTTLGIPAGLWAARRGARMLIAVSAVVWGVMTMACGAAQSFAQLLLARLGVGIGEAGGMPASQAMISALYAPHERATAQAILSAGINVGVFVAFLVGGYIGQRWGWRIAFTLAGIPTVLLALLFWLIAGDSRPSHAAAATPRPRLLTDTLRLMWSDRALRHLCIGATLSATVGYGAIAWLPSYLARSHGMTIVSAGAYIAVVFGLGGAFGTWFGGWLSDLARRHDVRWSLWPVALAFVAAKPFSIAFYLTDDTTLALLLFVLPAVIGTIFVGPTVAVVHERVGAEARAPASAILLVIVNFIGLGLGPILVGAVSQFVFAPAGENSLRYALALIQIGGIWGALHYYLAGGHLPPARTT